MGFGIFASAGYGIDMTSLKRSLVAAVSAAPLLLLTACGGGGSGSSSAPPSDADLVVVGKEYKFDKPEYTVKAGAVKISYTDKGDADPLAAR